MQDIGYATGKYHKICRRKINRKRFKKDVDNKPKKVYNYNCQEGNRLIIADRQKGEKMEDMGMTNEQYKGFLIDQLEDWEEVLELAEQSNDEKVIKKAKKQIKKINEKLKF